MSFKQSSDRPANTAAGAFAVRGRGRRAIQRWSITGNTATANKENDRLGPLAESLGAHFNDWKCIRPIDMYDSHAADHPADFDERYERYIRVGDTFDVSNLTSFGVPLRIHLFVDADKYAGLAKLFYPGSLSSSNADPDFQARALTAGAPIGDLVIMGHASGDTMFGDASSFTPRDFNPEEPVQTFNSAQFGMFPRRCWFSRFAAVRAVGCNTADWGHDFARRYLRRGAVVTLTMASVRGRCSGESGSPYVKFADQCMNLNGIEFATSHELTGEFLDGPFWTVERFHEGSWWESVKGAL
jgi:hypothetical protein